MLVPAVAGFTGATASAAGETLNLYTWAGMFDPDVLADFEKETGITVNYVNFDTDETMLAKLESTKGGDYDLVIADDYIIETVIAEGLAQKLNMSKLDNFGNINPVYQGPVLRSHRRVHRALRRRCPDHCLRSFPRRCRGQGLHRTSGTKPSRTTWPSPATTAS